jgi:hypothetical protein
MLQVAKRLKTTEKYLFEYLRRKGFIKPSSNVFSNKIDEGKFLSIERKGDGNRSKIFSKLCYVTPEGFDILSEFCSNINFKEFYKESEMVRAKNLAKTINHYIQVNLGDIDNSIISVLHELDLFSNNFPRFKTAYSMREVGKIFELNQQDIFILFIGNRWIRPKTYTFYRKCKSIGLFNCGKFRKNELDNIFKNGFVSFKGLLYISLAIRIWGGTYIKQELFR